MTDQINHKSAPGPQGARLRRRSMRLAALFAASAASGILPTVLTSTPAVASPASGAPVVVGYEVGLQFNTGHVWTLGSDWRGDWGASMMAGTSPSIAALANGRYEVAFQANTGHLWTVGSDGIRDLGLGMMSGTSPSIAALPAGGYGVAFQANTGNLWTMGPDGFIDRGAGMMSGTSPSIAALPAGGYEVAFQVNTGNLWTMGPDGFIDRGAGMMSGTSPSIAALPAGGYEVAFQVNTGNLWTMGPDGFIDRGAGMMSGTSPSIAALPAGGYEVAFQVNTGNLWTMGPDGFIDRGARMMSGTSPSIAALPGGGYEVAFQFNNGHLWTMGSDNRGDWGAPMLAATSPSITGWKPGTPWVVTVGDSYISGEGGRWAGNTVRTNSNGYDLSSIDVLGSTAYYDDLSQPAERIHGCHRSWAAESLLGSGTNGLTLACSGSTTDSHMDTTHNLWKPGLDFCNAPAKCNAYTGNKGQAQMLQEFAATHNVTAVAVSIGGDDFKFGDVVDSCYRGFVSGLSHCNQDTTVTDNFTWSNVAAQTAKIKQALLNVRQAMLNDGYADSSYTLVVQDYPSPIPNGTAFRYAENGSRLTTGGCPFFNDDADWANNTALARINGAVRDAVAQTGLSNIRTLELESAFNGHRLCENSVGLLEEKGLVTWRDAGAVDKSEWITQIRPDPFNYDNTQQSLHPNFWAQHALRNCLRQMLNSGAPLSAKCFPGAGLTSNQEPTMSLRLPVRVPNVVGSTLDVANKALGAFTVTRLNSADPLCRDGIVASQTPSANTTSYPGNPITIWVYIPAPSCQA